MTKKILVVDDDEGIIDAISLILESEGYTIQTILKAEETLNRAITFKPDLILLDILMSGIDGRDVCRLLKQETTTKNIPVIMVSAHPNAAQSALQAGANDFLPKPFEVDDLLQKINKYTA